MTISSSTSDTRYAGNSSTTAFATGFTFYDTSTLRVSTIVNSTGVETVKTLTTDYTVTGGAGATGTVTFLTAPATGETVVIQRQEPYSQLTNLGTNDPLPAAVLELSYDKLAMQIQQIYRRTLTAIQSPAGFDPNTATPYTMPTPSSGRVLVGNTGGTGWDNASILTLVGVLSVVVASLADRDVLEYDNAGGVWRNQTLATVLGRLLTTRGDVLVRGASAPQRLAVGAAGTYLKSDGTDASWGATPVLRSYLAGMGTSNNAVTPNTKIDVAAGQWADNTNAQMFTSAASTIDCGTTGANGLDTGALANSTWYHVWAIGKADGTAALLASTSVSAPTMPTGYTLKRRIGSFKTDGSAHILAYVQYGDRFLWKAPVVDQNPATVNATAGLYALSVPTGLAVVALVRMLALGAATFAIYSPNQNSETVGNQAAPANLTAVSGTTGNAAASNYEIVTDTSGRIAAVCNTAGGQIYMATDGWLDRRGRDS